MEVSYFCRFWLLEEVDCHSFVHFLLLRVGGQKVFKIVSMNLFCAVSNCTETRTLGQKER